jgi:hypothetical protein
MLGFACRYGMALFLGQRDVLPAKDMDSTVPSEKSYEIAEIIKYGNLALTSYHFFQLKRYLYK